MDIPHLLVLELVVLATLVTLYGLVAAVVSSRRQVLEEKRRIAIAERLYNWEIAEASSLARDVSDDARDAVSKKYAQLYTDFGIVRATYGNMHFLGAYEAARIAGVLLQGARFNLGIAGLGVVLGGIAAVWGAALS